MKALGQKILNQLIDGSAEPVIVAKINSTDWPVVLCNPAFEALAGDVAIHGRPFADVIEKLFDRALAIEISEAIRARLESTIPVEIDNQEFLLALKPLVSPGRTDPEYYAGYLRGAATVTGAVAAEAQQALVNAKRRIRDLSREDPVTGLLNAQAFRDVLDHDWSVARREKSRLSLVAFTLDEFDQYLEVFGRHAAHSCQRRVAGAIRRCLKRASDVAARIDGGQGYRFVVLSHSADETLVREFASRIATSVRELGLHHPRSRVGRFVTVSYQVMVQEVGADNVNAAGFLDSVLS
jgi:diguanylate cyclase (GGDEF)-like protein